MKLIECPRDAMQGWHSPIATELKIRYIKALLQVGFDTLDFGSFVSPKAIPQMADTNLVIEALEAAHWYNFSQTKLLAIIANYRGAEEACQYESIRYLGYPFSISETFQLRNTNKTIAESFPLVQQIQELCVKTKKEMVLYISMGFGNPYNDPYNPEMVAEWVEKMKQEGIKIISLSDTVGVAEPQLITDLFTHLQKSHPDIEFGSHFHARPDNWLPNIKAAYLAGCRRFDGALNGIGGCPMAKDELVGNMATQNLISFLEEQGEDLSLDFEKLQEAIALSGEVFA